MIARLGKEINSPDSVYYWAYKVYNRHISGQLVAHWAYKIGTLVQC